MRSDDGLMFRNYSVVITEVKYCHRFPHTVKQDETSQRPFHLLRWSVNMIQVIGMPNWSSSCPDDGFDLLIKMPPCGTQHAKHACGIA